MFPSKYLYLSTPILELYQCYEKNTDVNITWPKQVTAIHSELLNKSSEKYQPYYIFIIGFIIVMGYIEFVTCVLFLEFADSFINFPASLVLQIKAFKMNEC